jgi:hypothetical protein
MLQVDLDTLAWAGQGICDFASRSLLEAVLGK